MVLELNSLRPDPHIWGFCPFINQVRPKPDLTSPSAVTSNESQDSIFTCHHLSLQPLFALSLLFCLHAPSIILSFSKLGQQVTSPLNPSFPPPSSFPPLGIHLPNAPAGILSSPEARQCLEESVVDNLAWWPSVTSVGRTLCTTHHFLACPLTSL